MIADAEKVRITLRLGRVEILRLPLREYAGGVGHPHLVTKRDRFGRAVSREITPPEIILISPQKE